MSREDPQVKLRLPAELRDKVAASAQEQKRSMNADMVDRLERSFDRVIFAARALNTDDLISILSERLAKKDCELRISKRERIEDSAKISDEVFGNLIKKEK